MSDDSDTDKREAPFDPQRHKELCDRIDAMIIETRQNMDEIRKRQVASERSLRSVREDGRETRKTVEDLRKRQIETDLRIRSLQSDITEHLHQLRGELKPDGDGESEPQPGDEGWQRTGS